MLFYEESYDLPEKYDIRFLPILFLMFSALAWKMLLPFYAVVAIFAALTTAIATYIFRSSKMRVTREEIQFEGALKFLPIPTSAIKQAMTAE